MTQVFYHMPPELSGSAASRGLTPGEWCLICLLFAKGDQVTATRETWGPLVNDGDDTETRWIEYPRNTPVRTIPKIQDAVTMGISDFFPTLLIPVCWTHMAAIAPPEPGPACSWCNGTGRKGTGQKVQAARQLPPGLDGGNGHPRRR